MEIRQAVGAAAFAGLFAAGIVMTGADAVVGQIEVDGVTLAVLESSDYMPPEDPGGE